MNTYDVPCAYDETDLESSEKIFSVFPNYLSLAKRKACKAVKCNDMLHVSAVFIGNGKNQWHTTQCYFMVHWKNRVHYACHWADCSDMGLSLSTMNKVEMQNSNRSQTIWFCHILNKEKDQNLLRVLAWRFGKCWSIGFLNTGNGYGADTWERNRKGGGIPFLWYFCLNQFLKHLLMTFRVFFLL